ncbi:MAG TPA: acetamidase/formamidase family protein [Thermomicrobiales bacterium]|nr:acetamidase/formamidase family protein [Thermomicrobiales bacterium]
MQHLSKANNLVYTCSPFHEPKLTVQPGETFQVDTELTSGDWLQKLTDDPASGRRGYPYVNPATGPVFVAGAKPGDAIVVHIDAIDLIDIGYTQLVHGKTPFPNWIREEEWGDQFKVVRIADGLVHWSDQIRIPIAPMIGVIGVAPEIEAISNADNGVHGGNLDIQEVTAGNRVILPVFVEGALLHVGDVHAVQGDGELCCAGGIETRSTLTLRVEIIPKPEQLTWPRIETETHLIAIGCARPLDDAFRIAVTELVHWMVAEHGFTEPEALMLLGQVAEARATQFVNPKFTYVCKIARQYLAAN